MRTNKAVLKRPDEENSVSAKTVTAYGTVFPLNEDRRAPEMGSTYPLLSRSHKGRLGDLLR